MQKFYEISTDKYAPLSYENQYLHTRYEQIANLLSLYLDKDYKYILAKPIHNGYQIEWYSPFKNLQDVRGNKGLSDFGYFQYHTFLEDLKKKINEYANSRDPDKQDWANILNQVFNSKDNIVFSNGDNISIIWGWKFDNKEIYKPNITPPLKEEPTIVPDTPPGEDVLDETPEQKANPEEKTVEETEPEIKLPIDEPSTEPERENGFINFLKWFASRYAWLLILLIILTALVFTFKSLKYN